MSSGDDLDFLRWWGVPTLSGAHMCPTRPSATSRYVHFDAHYDTYDDLPNWYGAYDSAGHWASKSVHEQHGTDALARLTERDDRAEHDSHRLRADLRYRRPPRSLSEAKGLRG